MGLPLVVATLGVRSGRAMSGSPEREFTEISYEEAGHVGVLTLNRPEARNALTFTTYAELEEAVRTTTARCLVITGADPAFCSGDDVKQVMRDGGERLSRRPRPRASRSRPAADALLHTDVPVIAAVNGAAVGWGMELALMADIRVASEKARFGELFVKRGLCSRRARHRPPRPAGGAGAGRRAALHRPDHRRRRGRGDRPRLPSRAPRRPAPDRHGPRPGDRRQPAARRAADEGRAAGDARPRLARARPVGERHPGRAVPDRRSPRGRRRVPREARTEVHGRADHRPRARSVDVSTRCGRPRRARRR